MQPFPETTVPEKKNHRASEFWVHIILLPIAFSFHPSLHYSRQYVYLYISKMGFIFHNITHFSITYILHAASWRLF